METVIQYMQNINIELMLSLSLSLYIYIYIYKYNRVQGIYHIINY